MAIRSILEDDYSKKRISNIEIYVNSKVSLNGLPSQTYMVPDKNLLGIKSVNKIYDFVKKMERLYA